MKTKVISIKQYELQLRKVNNLILAEKLELKKLQKEKKEINNLIKEKIKFDKILLQTKEESIKERKENENKGNKEIRRKWDEKHNMIKGILNKTKKQSEKQLIKTEAFVVNTPEDYANAVKNGMIENADGGLLAFKEETVKVKGK